MDALLAGLARLPNPTPHLQHLAIRLRRTAHAYQDIHQTAASRDEHKARLLSRLDELEEQLDELGAATAATGAGDVPDEALTEPGLGDGPPEKVQDGGRPSYVECAALARQLRLKLAATPPTPIKSTQSAATSHARSSSTSTLARKSPPSHPADPSLAAFLASASTAPPPLPSRASASSTLQARAQELSSAFTLHLLANEPASVLRPGQSLASLFRKQLTVAPPNAPRPTSEADTDAPRQDSLEEQVRATVQAAFLDDLAARLTQPAADAATAPAAWRELRRSLWEAAGPLIPGRMGAGKTKSELQARFLTDGGGDFDLVQATALVHRLVGTLAQLCAPSRDGQVRAVLSALSQDDAGTQPSVTLSLSDFVSAVRQALALAADMAKDVAAFRSNLASAVTTDDELEAIAAREAVERERAVILSQYAGSAASQGAEAQRAVIDASVGEWVARKMGADVSGWAGAEGGWKAERVADALVETVFDEQAVALPEDLSDTPAAPADNPAASPPPNLLPPTLVVPSPRLFNLQNKFQAVVILACLLSLAGAPAAAPANSATGPAWLPRVWTLLTAASTQPPPASTAAADDPPTRIANLADEILSATYGPGAEPTPAVEAERTRIRQGTDRILRYEDPVFKLLRGRLKAGLKAALLANLQPVTITDNSSSLALPTLRTGRAVGRGDLRSPEVGVAKAATGVKVEPIRGFVSPALLWDKVQECAVELVRIEEWQRRVWGPRVEGRE